MVTKDQTDRPELRSVPTPAVKTTATEEESR